MFNARNELDGYNVIQVNLPIPAGTYTIRQENPALAIYNGDADIAEEDGVWVKEKEYTLPEDDVLSILLLKGEGTAVVTVDETTYTFNYNLD